jgi:hypothetical protein
LQLNCEGRSPMFIAECSLAVVATVLALCAPSLGRRWFASCEQALSRVAERRRLAVVIAGLGAMAARLAVMPVLPIPEPAVHDEFGYLLLADTFARGRLTNPPNPMWIHFESFHIIWQPTYTAMFYPAQGFFLALGQVIFGHPFWGVWLSAGLMCAAICWMLQGWMPPGWALLGGFLAVIRIGTFSYWANSYWGGAVAATGGALVLGALPRLRQSPRLGDALLMGLGFALIANTRPYEGVFLGIPVAAVLIWSMFRLKPPMLKTVTVRVALPLVAIGALTAAGMAYYFLRTTGSLWMPPYMVDLRAYNPVPYFPWQSLRAIPKYNHQQIHDFYLGTILDRYRLSRSVQGYLGIQLVGLVQSWSFFLGPVLSLPVAVALATLGYGFSWARISRPTRLLLLICGAVTLGSILPLWSNPHYAAPVACAILALVLIAMRRVRGLVFRGKPTGVFLTRAIPAVCLLMALLRVAGARSEVLACPAWPAASPSTPTWCSPGPTNAERVETLSRLATYPGKQLAIVHYDQTHEALFHEWVYNSADIEAAKVIFARDMGPTRNQELIDYFRDRHVWLVQADATPPTVETYDVAVSRNPTSSGRGPQQR